MSFFGGGISISANKCINTANEAAYSITFKNLEIGEAYTYNITDGTNNINDGFTATDKTEAIVEDLSGFDEGDVFITLTDSEGSVVKKVKKDTVSPSGYAVALSNPLGFTEISTQGKLDFTGLEVGALVNWRIDRFIFESIAGSFVASAASESITVDVSSLSDGNLQAKCTLTDACGNVGSEASSAVVVKDSVAPIGYSIDAITDPINNQNETNIQIDFINLEIGATAFWSITDGVNTINDDFIVAATSESIFEDVSTLNNGTLTVSLVLVDTAGNQGVIETGTTNKQVFTPSGYSVAFDEASYDGTTGLNATIDISGANVGNSYSLTITSSGGGTPIVYTGTVGSATFSISNIDLTTLNTGTGTATYFETDSFGNIGGDATDTADFVFATQFPDWDLNNVSGQVFIDALNDNQQPFDPNITGLFGSLGAGSKWIGGVLAPNGKVYGIPFGSTEVLEIDPVNQTTALFGSLGAGSKWAGGVLAPNGKIYGIPFGSAQVLEIDPVNQTTALFGSFSGSSKWFGGVLAPNGKIYGIPANSTQVLEIDPVNQTTALFGSLSGSAKWFGGVLAPNGKIYGIPRTSTEVLEIDPVNQTTALFGSLSGANKWYGGVLASNGKIYGIPFGSTEVLEIDPVNQTTALFGSFSGANKWYGGVLASNGKIYGIPNTSTQVLEIDPVNQTTALFGSLSGANKWAGGVLAPNGKIYGIPFGSAEVLEIGDTSPIDINFPLSRYVNKL
jgi:hypothetical protein